MALAGNVVLKCYFLGLPQTARPGSGSGRLCCIVTYFLVLSLTAKPGRGSSR